MHFQPEGGKNSLCSSLLLSKPIAEHPSPGCGWEPTPLSLPQCRWEVKFLAQHRSWWRGCCQRTPGWLPTPGHTPLPSPAGCASNQLLAFFFLISIICQRAEVPNPAGSRAPLGTSLHSPCHLALCHLQPFCKNHWSCSFYSLCCSFFTKYTSPWKSHLL